MAPSERRGPGAGSPRLEPAFPAAALASEGAPSSVGVGGSRSSHFPRGATRWNRRPQPNPTFYSPCPVAHSLLQFPRQRPGRHVSGPRASDAEPGPARRAPPVDGAAPLSTSPRAQRGGHRWRHGVAATACFQRVCACAPSHELHGRTRRSRQPAQCGAPQDAWLLQVRTRDACARGTRPRRPPTPPQWPATCPRRPPPQPPSSASPSPHPGHTANQWLSVIPQSLCCMACSFSQATGLADRCALQSTRTTLFA